MNKDIIFGPSGNSSKFLEDGLKYSFQAPKWLANMGLFAYEYSLGRGINISPETAQLISNEAEKYNVKISVHAPYYINLANEDELMIQKSFEYIENSLSVLKIFKGENLVIHTASCGKKTREDTLRIVEKNINRLLERLYEKKLLDNIYLCLETMGKHLQIGTYKEIIDLCSIDMHLKPTFDFGHINCIMGGGLQTTDDYQKIFDYCLEKLGLERTKNCHIHFSKIEYSLKGGEIKHHNFNEDFEPDYKPMIDCIIKNNYTPSIICESNGNQVIDALEMQNYYKLNKVVDKTKL